MIWFINVRNRPNDKHNIFSKKCVSSTSEDWCVKKYIANILYVVAYHLSRLYSSISGNVVKIDI